MCRGEDRVFAEGGGRTLTVLPFDHQGMRYYEGEVNPLQGWYAPEFGLKMPNPVIGVRRSGAVPFTYGYLLVAGKVDGRSWNVQCELQGDRETYSIALNGSEYRVVVDPAR